MTADIKLPPLPDDTFRLKTNGPCIWAEIGRWQHAKSGDDATGAGENIDAAIAHEMTAYATAAVLADRERVEGVMRMALEALEGYRREIGALTGSRAMGPCDAEAALREHLKEPR